MTDGFIKCDIRQTRGPTFQFEGRPIAVADFQTRHGQPLNMLLSIYEAAGGALVAVTRSEGIGGRAEADVRATVVKVGAPDPERPWIVWVPNEMALRLAVMDAFDWDKRARSMARKELGWQFAVEI